MRPQAAINCQCVKLAIGVGAKSTSGRSMRRRGITATGLAGLAKVGRVAPGRGAATQPPRVAEGFTFEVTGCNRRQNGRFKKEDVHSYWTATGKGKFLC